MAKDLTTKAVQNAKAQPAKNDPNGPIVRTEIPDGKSRGLFLVVQPSGARSWALRFRYNGKARKLTIGPVINEREGTVSDLPLGQPHTLAEARTAADRARIEVAHGMDPTARAAKAETDGMTVRTAVNRFVEEHCKRENRAWAEVDRQFKAYVLPALGERPLAEITGDDLRAVVRSIDASTMANRVHATIAKWCIWCADRERRLIASNPYEGFTKPHSEKSRDRVLSDIELAAIWREASAAGGHFGAIIRLLILTGQRRSEVTGLKRSELDYARAEWTIPAERAKNGNRTTVPLSGVAMCELAAFEDAKRDAFRFTTNGTTEFQGHQKHKDRMDAVLQFAEPWRLHDIRRTVATGLARLGIAQEVTEAILNHATGKVSGVAGIYNRHDYAAEKRAALTTWAHYVDWITNSDLQLAMDSARKNGNAKRAERIAKAHNEALRYGDEDWTRYVRKWLRYGRVAAAT